MATVSLNIVPAPGPDLRAHDHLNLIRGVASLVVLAGHARLALLRDTADVPHLQLWQKPLYFITHQATAAVLVFFVLSGFLVGSSILGALTRDRWSWRKYLAARFARIYTVLVPALLVGVAIDWVGMHFFADRPTYAGHYNAMLDLRISEAISPKIFLGNLLNLQTIFVHTLGSNRPLWSLAYEWWYYLLFPLAAAAALSSSSRTRRAMYVGIGVLIFWMLTPQIRWAFLIWLMGVAISMFPRIRPAPWMIYASVGAFIATLVISTAKLLTGVAVELLGFLSGLFTATSIYFICCSPAPSRRGMYRSIAEFLSGISYSLYLCHVPLIVLLSATVITGQRMLPNLAGIGATLILMAITLLYATAFYYLFERRTNKVRHLAERALRLRAGLSQP